MQVLMPSVQIGAVCMCCGTDRNWNTTSGLALVTKFGSARVLVPLQYQVERECLL